MAEETTDPEPKTVQIINMRNMDLATLDETLRPVTACQIDSTIAVQVINIEGLNVAEFGKAIRLVTACEISATGES